jgi:hypothetical protein
MANGLYRLKEQIKASTPGILAQAVPDEDLSGLKGDMPATEPAGPDSVDIVCIDIELHRPYRLVAPGDHHIQLVIPSESTVYMEPQTK